MERPRECHNKIMLPILSTIFDISSFKPFSVPVPGGGGGGGGGLYSPVYIGPGCNPEYRFSSDQLK